jgi:serine/threonine-protein kinase
MQLEPLGTGAASSSAMIRAAGAAATPSGMIRDGHGGVPHLPPEQLEQLEGHTLGHYQIGDFLGGSRFKAVFRARDTKADSNVALKVLSPQFPAGQHELKHFAQVMHQAMKLQHERLVTVYGVGKSGPYAWIAREYVGGESLAEVLYRMAVGERTRPKWTHGLRLAVDVGSALNAVHEAGLVHGRVVPANVLIFAGSKRAKLANLLLDEALRGSALAEAAKGKKLAQDVGYFSPEQCAGIVDARSDLYSLGALVYARLTARPPFQGETPERTMEMIVSDPVVPPRSLNPTVPEEFEEVVLRLLAREPADRYQDVASLLMDLERFTEAAEAGTAVR